MDWVAADWGTSNLRLWLMDDAGRPERRIESDQGMAAIVREDYEPTLLGLLRRDLPEDRTVPVLVCGMAGSRQGWVEAPYARVPCVPPSADAAVRVETRSSRVAVRILPGISQDDPTDVMRGEETQIAGVLQERPGFDGVICLPGTHTKWVHVSAGEIVSFRTYMTGELFALLRERSVLRHSLGGETWDREAFLVAVDRALSHPATVAGDLFALRAESLLRGLGPETAQSRLSGLLVGIELAAARPYWLGQQVAIVGETALADAYRAALGAQGLEASVLGAEAMTLAGLTAAWRHLKETAQ
ncbi:2-dehydro-3-deoxygalactonokinase [Roseivivax isoporae]|uniref:2-keto-3-deoxy-galactonokinase n=1 Tax=Roseivivax isoporae LMG 25204 TaxID=1449351 RepID=X7F6I8_9RHOB|nr:2-dehydro-3-deoxygalactonokinase [Roseivivax isoporae]ETX28358.1 2-keto-3-deoxy-galactonokinase [Roseivivax isoporae LMG 25204]